MRRRRSARSRRSRCARIWRSCARRTDFPDFGYVSVMRSRILALVGAAAVVAAVAVAILLLSGGSSDTSLAQAAEHLQRQSIVMEFRMEPVNRNEDFVMAGNTATSADGRQARIYVHAQYEGKDIEFTTLKVGSDVWVASNQFDGKLPNGKRWVHGGVPANTQAVTPSQFAEFLN